MKTTGDNKHESESSQALSRRSKEVDDKHREDMKQRLAGHRKQMLRKFTPIRNGVKVKQQD